VPVIVVTSSQPGEGKTGIAAVIARHYAYQGRAVRIVRVAGDGRAAEDAAWFASLAFAPGTPAAPVDAATVSDPGGEQMVVAEADPAAASAIKGAFVVLVARGAAPTAAPAGVAPAAVVVTGVAQANLGTVVAQASGAPVIVVPEDRTLAGFSVAEARAMLNAEVLVEGDGPGNTCDHLVIAPISSDAGQPHFRRFGTKAVVVRFDRTDMHLAAMQAEPECLILTGGRRPSDYLFDAAGAKGISVLLSRTDTENTVIALEGIFDQTRFQGDRKLDRMAALLEGTKLYEALGL